MNVYKIELIYRAKPGVNDEEVDLVRSGYVEEFTTPISKEEADAKVEKEVKEFLKEIKNSYYSCHYLVENKPGIKDSNEWKYSFDFENLNKGLVWIDV
jgi:hypothetical protein